MRVLGIDPGLTRCGLGVVEGQVGRPLQLVDVNVVRTSADLPIAERLVTIERGIDAWLDEHAPRRGRRRAGLRAVRLQHHHGHRPGERDRPGRGRPARAAGRDVHPERGQGRGLRQRPGRQGPGRRDGDPDPAARRAARSRPTPPTPWRWPSPTSGAAAPRPGSTRRSPRRPPRRSGMIAFVRGQVAAVGLTSAVVEVGGVGLEVLCTPGHARDAAPGPAGHPADQHGGPRGLADPVRVRRRGREQHVRAGADRLRRRAEAGAGDARRASARTTCARAIASEDVKTLTRVPGIGQKGAQRIILELRDRIGAPTGARRTARRRRRRARLARPGAAGPGRPRLVGQGGRPGGRRGRRRGRRAPDVGALLRAALRTLSRA